MGTPSSAARNPRQASTVSEAGGWGSKLLGAEGAWQTVDDAMQIFGGYGYIRGEYMIDRIWRGMTTSRRRTSSAVRSACCSLKVLSVSGSSCSSQPVPALVTELV